MHIKLKVRQMYKKQYLQHNYNIYTKCGFKAEHRVLLSYLWKSNSAINVKPATEMQYSENNLRLILTNHKVDSDG